jgi:predicted nucleotidyltransferase/uncharacterized protein with HEPN domain
MNARAAKRLHDSRKAATQLAEYVSGKTLGEFLSEEMWRYAIERQAGILASAIAASIREAPELRNRLPCWECVVELQACLSLEATSDDLSRLWDVVTRDVLPLLGAIDAELESFGLPEDSEESGHVQLQMEALVVRNLVGIAEICKQFGAMRLDVFGSATTGAFTDSSDIDFLVTFTPETKKSIGHYMEMEVALSALLGREIDLVDDKEFENPYFQHSVRTSRITVFDVGSVDQRTWGSHGDAPTKRDSSLRSE